MTIYILDNDPKKTAEMLDDKSLDKMIKDIAKVLTYAQHDYYTSLDQYENSLIKIDMPKSKRVIKWWKWARERKANYMYLVELGKQCLFEHAFRSIGYKDELPVSFKWNDKYAPVIEWARDNVPDLPEPEGI